MKNGRLESDQAGKDQYAESNDKVVNLEEEFELIDKELEKNNEYYFKQYVNGKSSASRRRVPNKATPSTNDSFKGDLFEQLWGARVWIGSPTVVIKFWIKKLS